MQQLLSEVPGLGRVVMCSDCDEVHLGVGRASFKLPRDMFLALARMMSEASLHPNIAGVLRYNVSFADGVPCFDPVSKGESA